jgi:hypothetical protein
VTFALIFSGCGSSRDANLAEVSGKVTLDGKPIESGVISFIPADLSGPTAGAEIVNGTYFIGGESGVFISECRVEISALKKTGEKVPTSVDPDDMTDVVTNMVPANYNTKSTLTAKIEAGENLNVDFSLHSTAQIE